MGPPPSSPKPWSMRGPRACIHKQGARRYRVRGPESTIPRRNAMREPVLVGIDVSAKTFFVAEEIPARTAREADYPNTSAGHRKLCRRLAKLGRQVRICL